MPASTQLGGQGHMGREVPRGSEKGGRVGGRVGAKGVTRSTHLLFNVVLKSVRIEYDI